MAEQDEGDERDGFDAEAQRRGGAERGLAGRLAY